GVALLGWGSAGGGGGRVRPAPRARGGGLREAGVLKAEAAPAELPQYFFQHLRRHVRRVALEAAKPAEAGRSTAFSGRRHGPGRHVAEAVILGPLGLVHQDVVGVLNLFELVFGILIAGIAVGMVLPRELAIGLGDLIFRGAARDSENLVKITRHGY